MLDVQYFERLYELQFNSNRQKEVHLDTNEQWWWRTLLRCYLAHCGIIQVYRWIKEIDASIDRFELELQYPLNFRNFGVVYTVAKGWWLTSEAEYCRTVCRTTKELPCRRKSFNKSVRDANGRLLINDGEQLKRWKQHHTIVLNHNTSGETLKWLVTVKWGYELLLQIELQPSRPSMHLNRVKPMALVRKSWEFETYSKSRSRGWSLRFQQRAPALNEIFEGVFACQQI